MRRFCTIDATPHTYGHISSRTRTDLGLHAGKGLQPLLYMFETPGLTHNTLRLRRVLTHEALRGGATPKGCLKTLTVASASLANIVMLRF